MIAPLKTCICCSLCMLLMVSLPVGANSEQQALQEFDAGNYPRAAEIWNILAEDGDSLAMYNLGLMYENGLLGVPRGDIAAFWYRLAARQNYAPAQYNLAGLYYQGNGVPKLMEDAILWWQLAAQQGLADAQYNLGQVYAYGGDGMQQDLALAQIWLSRAAAQGFREALVLLNSLGIDNLGIINTGNKISGLFDSSPVLDFAGIWLSQNTENVTPGRLDDTWEWFYRQSPDNYTLVIGPFRDKAAAEQFQSRNNLLVDSLVFRDLRNRYQVVMGSFVSRLAVIQHRRRHALDSTVDKPVTIRMMKFRRVRQEFW